MRIGVVSDTHNRLPNVERIVAIFNDERVDRVVHTGDITQPKTLRALGRLDAPLFGVFGNNDEREALEGAARELGFALARPEPARAILGSRASSCERSCIIRVGHEVRVGLLAPPPLELEWANRRILVVHDPRDIAAHSDGHDLVLHGHTHTRVLEREDGRLVFNPGECAGHMPGYNAVGIVDLATLAAEIRSF